VTKIIVTVFIGGTLGAMLRECFMLMTPKLADDFPLDILVANLGRR
jgi:CrcB protein